MIGVLLELYRDTIGLPVNTLIDSDAVLLGTAMNAAVAAGLYGSTLDAVKAMQQPRQAHNRDVKSADRIARDYRIFCEMIAINLILLLCPYRLVKIRLTQNTTTGSGGVTSKTEQVI